MAKITKIICDCCGGAMPFESQFRLTAVLPDLMRRECTGEEANNDVEFQDICQKCADALQRSIQEVRRNAINRIKDKV